MKKNVACCLAGLVMIALTVTCSDADKSGAGELSRHRGLLRFHTTDIQLKLCGTEAYQPIVDSTDGTLADIYNNLAGEGQSIYVVFDGIESGDGIIIKDLKRADPPVESPDCAEDLTGIYHQARGNEPFWTLTVTESAITFIDVGQGDTLVFPFVAADVQPEGTVYGVVTTADGTHSLQAAFFARRCRDSMSGAYFSLTAEVVVDGYHYSGCALEGWAKAPI